MSRRFTIVLVEDHKDTRELVCLLLRDQYNVFGCESVAEVLTCLSDQECDLILSDLALGGESGYTLIEAVRGNPAWRYLPVVAMTAHAGRNEHAKAIAAGFDDFLTKPVELELLLQTVQKYLKRVQSGSV